MARRKAPSTPKEKILSKLLPESAQKGSGVQDSPFIAPTYANDRRIGSPEQARELWVRLYLENQLRAQAFAQIRNQIEGGRPFDPDSLVRNGEGWRTNVNFNDARAAFRRVSMPYWKMVHEVPRKISVSIHSQAPEVDKWNVAMATCYDMFLDDWGPGYFLEFSGMTDDYVMYGTGHGMYPQEWTPRWKWMPSVQVLMPKRTKADVDKWELVALKREMTASELVELVENDDKKKSSKDAGWNPDAVERAIRLAVPGPSQTRYFDPNFWQDMIVSNDLVIGGVWPPVSVIDLWAFTKDNKKIRHYIFTEKNDVPEYLYEADEGVDKFRRIFPTAFYNVGSNGLYHSIKGFGVMNYYYATAINRTKCRLIDGATFAMGMNFVKDDNTPGESPPVENYSMVNIFPTGLNQLQFYPQLSAAQQMLAMLSQNQDENNFTYNEPQKDIADTKTARQAVILADIANEMSTAGSSIFLSQMGSNFFAESFRRLCLKGSTDPDAIKFKKRCRALLVPLEVIEDDEKFEKTVKTGASPTTASPVAREQIGNTLMTQIMQQPDANRRAILEFRVANLTGADGVGRFLLPIGVASDPRARREAMMENVDLAQGIPLPVDPSDAHVEHCDEHLKPLEQIVGLVQQPGQPGGAPPPQGQPQMTPDHLMALQMGLPHIAQHLQMLSTNEAEKAQYQQLKARYTKVAAVAQGIMARLSRAHAASQQSGQPLQAADVQTAINTPSQ